MAVGDNAGGNCLPIRLLVADDHPAMREGLAAVIAGHPDLRLVAVAENGRQAVELYREHLPDVGLVDLRMPVVDGVEAIRAITRDFPSARLIALTTFEGDPDIPRALEAGARGHLLKDMLLSEVIGAVRATHRGQRVIPPALTQARASALWGRPPSRPPGRAGGGSPPT
jgi:two-component system, NarL family, response regulator